MSQSLHLRRLGTGDLPFADSLRALAGWNQTLADWQRFLALEPEGCFLAEWDGRPAGTAATLIYAPSLAWIGMVLVHPDFRRRGIGRALLAGCIDHLRRRGVQCIKLDATPAGKRVYDTLGFVDEWTLMRWEHPGLRSSLPMRDPRIRGWRATDVAAIDPLDTAAFGVCRQRLVHTLADRSERAVILHDPCGRAAAYGFLRRGSRAFYLGPVAAATDEAALAIITALLSDLSSPPVFWDIPDANTAAVEWARRHGFHPQRTLTRMHLGRDCAPGDPRRQFALAGPETG